MGCVFKGKHLTFIESEGIEPSSVPTLFVSLMSPFTFNLSRTYTESNCLLPKFNESNVISPIKNMFYIVGKDLHLTIFFTNISIRQCLPIPPPLCIYYIILLFKCQVFFKRTFVFHFLTCLSDSRLVQIPTNCYQLPSTLLRFVSI